LKLGRDSAKPRRWTDRGLARSRYGMHPRQVSAVEWPTGARCWSAPARTDTVAADLDWPQRLPNPRQARPGTLPLGRPRGVGFRACSPALDYPLRFRCLLRRINIPFVHAHLACIDQRRANVVVQICARPADRTGNSGQFLPCIHRGAGPFFARVVNRRSVHRSSPFISRSTRRACCVC